MRIAGERAALASFARVALCGLLALLSATLEADFRDFAAIPVSRDLESRLDVLAEATIVSTPTLARENFSITLIDLGGDGRPVARASYRPENTFHPASVVKLFFLVATHQRLHRSEIPMTAELRRGLEDMIVDSGNDATAFVVDTFSGVSSGPELPPRAFRKWAQKRMWVNRYFASLGYDIQASGKTWCENLYGREMQLLGKNRENRNRIASEQPAALLLDIVSGRAVSPAASREMMKLLERDVDKQRSEGENQVHEFLGEGLPSGSQIFSKAGWTSEVRHDAAYIVLPNGRRYIVVVLTRGVSGNKDLLPRLGQQVAALFE